MYSKTDRIRAMCKSTAKMIEDQSPSLRLCFIVHGSGQFAEAVALSEREIIAHPAQESAKIIIQKNIDQNHSSFLGLAIARKSGFLGLGGKDKIMALININVDDYPDTEQAYHDVLLYSWHAMDLMEARKKPEYKEKFKSGPMIPKRSSYNLAKANLRADAFAAILAGTQKQKDPIKRISMRRAFEVLHASSHVKAEDTPFLIAMETTDFAFSDMIENGFSKSDLIKSSHKAATEISSIIDQSDIGIEQWWAFAKPAQDMAWRGHTPEEILGAALSVSEDPYIRSICYLISDVTGLKALPSTMVANIYNPFANPQHNSRLHNDLVDTIFEEVFAASVQQNDSSLLILAANQQNENLSRGQILGWCASSLQASARAFDLALARGSNVDIAARVEFSASRENTSWDSIKTLGEKIIDRKRQGYVMTLGHVADLCDDIKEISDIMKSVQTTLKDKDYIRKLEAANELNIIPTIIPSAPAPKMAPTYQASTPAFAPRAPGLGGSAMSQAALRQKVLQTQKVRIIREEENQ